MATRRTPRAEPRLDSDLNDEAAVAPSSEADAKIAETSAGSKTPIVLLALLMLLAAGAVFVYLWRQDTAPPSAIAPSPAIQPPAVAETPIRHPIGDAKGATSPVVDTKPLPALMVSDITMQNTLTDLFGPASLGKVFYEDAIIHRFVTTIDNLPRKSLPSRNLPVKPIPGPLVASTKDGNVTISDENAARYAPYVQIAENIDAKNLVSAYVHFYPLMQQDYRDLGYPKGYFNDRLIDAIDDLLAAPEARDPPQVTQPKVLYEYADPDLETRSAGQKIMLRMGSDNAAKLKAKLREIRAQLTAAGKPDASK